MTGRTYHVMMGAGRERKKEAMRACTSLNDYSNFAESAWHVDMRCGRAVAWKQSFFGQGMSG